jgi:hypothetical protein
MTVPRTPGDRRKGSHAAAVDGRQIREAQLPPLFVRLRESDYYGAKFAQARIRIRRGCYQYLVWRDGDKTREFYLGKRENRTPRISAGAGGSSSSTRISSSRPSRGTNRA